MVFNTGTGITDHIDMLDKLIEVVTSRALTAVVVNAGGANYVVGEILDISATGSTSTIVAQLEVTTVAAGVVTGVRVYRGGAYTVDPTTTTANVSTSTGFTYDGTATTPGTGATFDLTFSAATWSVNRRTQQAASAVVGTAGTGYNIGDVLTVVGGVFGDVDGTGTQGTAATFTVATLTGGAGTGVATVTLTTAGNYEETPANDAATTNSGSGNDACALTVTYEDPAQTDTDFQVCMLEGSGLAAADEIHVMIKTYTQVNGFDDAFNWQLMGATSYNNTLPIHSQVGLNTTQIDTGHGGLNLTDAGGCVMVLKNNDADPDIAWWIRHTGRQITLVCKVESNSTTQYSSMYVGFLNQFGTDTEYPYPLVTVTGTNDLNRTWFDSSNLSGGLLESYYNATGDPQGPGFVRKPDGSWMAFASTTSSSASNRNLETEFGIYPFINPTSIAAPDQKVNLNSFIEFAAGIIPATGVPGVPTLQLKPTPGTGDDYYWLVPPIVGRWENSGVNLYPEAYNLFGELDGIFWFSTGGNSIVSEDRFVLGTKRYSIFQNGNRTQSWSYMAIDED